jgi:hypothetical protein
VIAESSFLPVNVGWVAIVAGIVGLSGLVFIILLFTIGQPFGTLNDLCIGVAAILSAVLAWLFVPAYDQQPFLLRQAGPVVASLGALIVAAGSILVISGARGWFLAGLYMAAGNGLIGLWLLSFSYAALRDNLYPHGLVIFGLVTGLILALGLFGIPGILKGVDSTESAHRVINYLGQAGSLGYLVLYPVWCILLGRTLIVK